MSAPLPKSRRTPPSASFELTHPEIAVTLRNLRRDPGARLSYAAAGQGALCIEQGAEEHLLVHYVCASRSLSVAGGWLGAGRRRYIWIPLRPTLAWHNPEPATPGEKLSSADLQELAADLHAGFELLDQRHVIEEFLPAAPIPEEERRAVFAAYSAFMHAHGWEVTFDDAFTRRSLRRVGSAEAAHAWPTADREDFARLEARVAEHLKGTRSTSRILHQRK